MANNHAQFIAFDESITISSAKRSTLKTNREAIRDRIRDYFNANWDDKVQPKFHWQGSYAMRTILNPIKDEGGLGVYDLDDGVYFVGNSEMEKETIDWYHKEILKAVEEHTSLGAEDRKTCVRVLYADGHHIDLPIYYMLADDEHPKSAHKKEGWIDSDPRGFLDWFNGRDEHPQLRRIVKYLKAWCEYIHTMKDKKMPSGCILTMLAVKYYQSDVRDDVAMKNILVSMYNALSKDDGFHCYRPTFPKDEDLFENYSDTRKENFLNELDSFKEDAIKAINNTNPHEGCLKWQKHFGDRFCCSTAKDEDEDAQRKEMGGTLNSNSRFA